MTREDKEVVSMKSIEERAREYTKRQRYRLPVYKAYVAGAIEQKEIDIEKACKVYRNELQRLKTLLDESVGVPANLIPVDKSLSRIRLEMEESL